MTHFMRAFPFTAVFLLALVLGACNSDPPAADRETTSTTSTIASTTTTAAVPATLPAGDECPDVFCVRYDIHPEAAWADGVPVTTTDFVFTYETIMNDQLDIVSRQGYELVTGYDAIDDKTVLFSFSEIYGPWQQLFDAVLPEHALAGRPFNSVWDSEITLGSGPFVFGEWIEGERITLRRNPTYWAGTTRASGEALGDIEEVHFVLVEDEQALVDSVRRLEVDLINPRPQPWMLDSLRSSSNLVLDMGLGPIWEHITFNHTDPLLSRRFIRQAIALAIDRDAVVEAIVRPVADQAQPLGNTIWLNSMANHEDHFNAKYPHDPATAEQLLVDNGCRMGEDGVYACDGERLSFRWTATANDEDRQTQFDLVLQDLAAIGIELVPSFGPESEVYSNAYIYGDATVWQMFNFAYIRSSDPAGNDSLYRCEGEAPSGFGLLNFGRYCNDEIDALMRAVDRTADPQARAGIYNDIDEIFLDDIAVIPLYQKPTLLAANAAITGPANNPSPSTDLWNVASWAGKETVLIGVTSLPESLQILEPDGNDPDGVTAMVAAAVLEGAFALDPTFRRMPVLIESVEPIFTE